MKKSLRKILTTGAIGLASLLPMKAEAQVTGNVEYVQSETNQDSHIELKGFYGLPQGVRGFTFMELHKERYFGKTYLDKEISNGIGPRLMAVHGNEPISEIALGLTVEIPNLPKGAYAQVGLLPVWFGNEGKIVGDKAFVGYSFGFPLPLGLNLRGFGDWDVLADNSPQWDYGELELSKSLDNFFVGYNPVLFNKGNAVPKLEHRVNIGVNF